METYDANGAPAAAPDGVWEGWPDGYPRGGLLFYGDNKEVLANLLTSGFRGKVNLIYIDPPFDSGADYVRKVQLRGVNGATKVEGENYSLGEQIQYTDVWTNDNYLQFMYERLILLKELMADGGAIFLHCDSSKGHHLRCLMDEVFGPGSFVNEIVWSYRRWPSNTDAFQSMHDTIFYYTKEISHKRTFHRQYEGASESYLKRFGGKTQVLDEETGTRKITKDEETKGMPLRDVWDISVVAGSKSERTTYPTQKPETLLERMIEVASNPDDLVLDCFIGSGTTAAVAQKLGRRWIGCDINKGAIQTTSKRLQKIISAQVTEAAKPSQNGFDDAGDEPPSPVQTGFAVYRVNDYDLAIQHNEAVNLACEHIGVERKKTDPFFDGTLGGGRTQELVKIVPFDHPLGIEDLEAVKRELESRGGEETRGLVVVSVGKELAVDAWLEEWNKHRGISRLDEQNRPIEFVKDPGHRAAHRQAVR
jgi:DNA modification methylase